MSNFRKKMLDVDSVQRHIVPSTEVVHRPRLHSPLQIDPTNLCEICSILQFPSTRRLLSQHFKARSEDGDRNWN